MENWFKPGGTDTGLNFFYPGKNEEGQKLFVTGIACLAYGLAQYNEPWAKKKVSKYLQHSNFDGVFHFKECVKMYLMCFQK